MHVRTYPNPVRSLNPSNLPYRGGAWTPNEAEVDAFDLEVIEGSIPPLLDGVYLRNTENPLHDPIGRYHPFDGDGMLHQISFSNGKADYRNRWIRTRAFAAEQEAGHALWAGIMERPARSLRRGQCTHPGLKDASSTDVVVHAGMVLSTHYQCGDAYRLDPETLETVGVAGWTPIDGVSAHTKVDERTGELLFFNYSLHAPYMHYGVVDRHNRLIEYIPVPMPGPRLPHDMAFSENFAILNALPSYWDQDLMKDGIYLARFRPDEPSRFAVFPRRGAKPEDIRYFEGAPTYVLHWLNAYEEGDELVMDGYFQDNPMPPPAPEAPKGFGGMMALLDLHQLQAKLHRWRFNLATGETREERLSDRVAEFGMINPRHAGRDYRYVYSALGEPGMFLFSGLVKHDLKTGQDWELRLAPGEYGSESPFIPRADGQEEDDGYLVTFTTNEARGVSDCLLIDAKRFDEGPVCRIRLPHKISSGTHSTWASRAFIRDGFAA